MFIYNINVPLNEEGIRELNTLDDNMSNVTTFELNEQQYDYLRKPAGLFSKFDKHFGTIIDACEEERILKDNLDRAVFLVREERKRIKSKEEETLNVIEESLNLTKRSGTFWEIDIFLEEYQNE